MTVSAPSPARLPSSIPALKVLTPRASVVSQVKPAFGLVLPAHFRLGEPEHLAELEAVLPLVASLLPSHRVQLISDSEDALLLVPGAQRRRDADLEALAFAIVLLDRPLAEEFAHELPTRFVGRSPIAFTLDKWRLSFVDPNRLRGVPAPAPTARRRGCLFIDPAFPAELLAGIRGVLEARFGPHPVLRAPHADGLWLEQAARALELDPSEIEVATVESLRDASLEEVISTDPLALCLAEAGHRTLLSPKGELLRFAPDLQREDLYLFKGEDLDGLLVRERIAGVRPEAGHFQKRSFVEPLISLVIPVYDRDEEILKLARSIAQQPYRALEVIFVTNGSPEGTLEALRRAGALLTKKRIRVRQIDFARAFGCATVPRDVGVYAARGEFVCFIDSDDYFEPNFFDSFAVRPSESDVIYSPHKVFRNGGRQMEAGFPFDVPLSSGEDIHAGLFEVLSERGNIFNNSGVVISRELFLAAGGIQHDLRYCEDYYLWLRMAKLGARAVSFPGQVSITLHPGNNELRVGDRKWLEIAREAAKKGNLL